MTEDEKKKLFESYQSMANSKQFNQCYESALQLNIFKDFNLRDLFAGFYFQGFCEGFKSKDEPKQ